MPDSTLILGIETSCDETAAAVVVNGTRVLSSVVASQNDLHAEYGGVVPELASRAHVERILPVVRRAVADAGLKLVDLHAVAVGHRPGLIGSLVVGVSAAKALAWSLGLPLIGVDHVRAHLYAGDLRSNTETRSCEPDAPAGGDTTATPTNLFPALGLVVSGGHTSLYRVDSWTSLTRLGATIDDAMGEAFDKAAAILGIPFPGGPNLDRLARTPGANDRAHDFPVSRLAPRSLDFSFSGLKTAMLYAVRGVPLKGGVFERDHTMLNEGQRADLAASFQRAAARAAILKLERALELLRSQDGAPKDSQGSQTVRTLLVGGGVSANSRLRSELSALAARENLRLRLPAMAYCVDNAAMIAGLGFQQLAIGDVADLRLSAVPTTAC